MSLDRGARGVPAHRKFWWTEPLLFLLIVLAIFNFPRYPAHELDPSWRMALAWCFSKGMQFGRDVVFAYGPLGFLMARTYFGLHFWTFIVWELFLASTSAAIILYTARRSPPVGRAVYIIFFLLIGIDPNALQMIMIVLVAFELIRQAERPSWKITVLIALFLVVLSLVKFTLFILSTFSVIVACIYQVSLRRGRDAFHLAAVFFVGYLVFWMICGQNPLNLPAYFYNSLQISIGYQEAVGLATPTPQLWKAVTALILVAVYAMLYFVLEPNKRRSLAFSILLIAFIFLNWKHGFVRSDMHMLHFFSCALLPVVAFPSLLDDTQRLGWVKRLLLLTAGVMCVWGIQQTVSRSNRLVDFEKIANNVYRSVHWTSYRRSFDDLLRKERTQFDLPDTRTAVGNGTIDVLGFEQAVALYNGLNYRSRPVLQSYSAYTPHLASLNYNYYLSDHAPDYVLLKVQTMDQHLPTLDDGLVLRLLPHHYRYILSEKGYSLWGRRDSKPKVASFATRPLRIDIVPLNTPLALNELSEKQLWAAIDIRPSLLGRLRSFFYKSAFVNLVIKEDEYGIDTFQLVPGQAKTGFFLNPPVENAVDYLQLAAGTSSRRARTMEVQVSDSDKRFFAATARVELSELPRPAARDEYSMQLNKARFWMFSPSPISFRSAKSPREIAMDGRAAIIMELPSQMDFTVPPGATHVSGSFGFVPGAYQNQAQTKGAEFSVVWTDGEKRVEIYKRFLDPLHVEADRGLQDFNENLGGITGGKLLFEINPGPSKDASWGWTVWAGIAITGPSDRDTK